VRSNTVSPGNFATAGDVKPIGTGSVSSAIALPNGEYTRVAIGFTDDLSPTIDGDGNLQGLCGGIDLEGLNDDSVTIFTIVSAAPARVFGISTDFVPQFSATVSDTVGGMSPVVVYAIGLVVLFFVIERIVGVIRSPAEREALDIRKFRAEAERIKGDYNELINFSRGFGEIGKEEKRRR